MQLDVSPKVPQAETYRIHGLVKSNNAPAVDRGVVLSERFPLIHRRLADAYRSVR